MRGKWSILLAPLALFALFLVACGEVDSTKTADDGVITAGEEASFTITVVAEPTSNPICDPNSANVEATVAGFGTLSSLCRSSGTITDPLPTGILWDFEILQNTGTGSCVIAIDAISGQRTLNCVFDNLAQPFGTTVTAGVFSVRVFGLTDPNDCPRTLTNTATVRSGRVNPDEPPVFSETETPTDTIEVVCAAGTVIEPPDIDPIGDPDPDIDISATPSTVFPTPGTADPDGDGPSVGTGDSGLTSDGGKDGLMIAIVVTAMGLAGIALALGAIRFARR